MQTDKTLYDAVVNCDIINADGQSIVWASRILKQPLPERVAGADLMINLMDLAGEKGYKVFLFGAKEEIVSKVAKMYRDKFGNQVIAGYRNGYYAEGEEEAIAKTIAESAAQMLFVAISSPKKEIFLNKYKDIIKTPFIMGVGGTFDVISGHIKRAPIWMQKAGLEWLYRTYQEPKRMWKRYLITNTKFIELLFREKFINKTR
ncbi:WecB/TagA/CpsF family glycosyltransferase [Sphingobacterium mizutaii]|nr:WecB/TagA/CpsF family glycosyltransferase [Sphingobacterium mizutaii]